MFAEGLRGLALPCGMPRFELLLRSDRQQSAGSSCFRMRTRHLTGTNLAILGGESDLDDLVFLGIESRGPTTTPLSFGASGLFGFPVDGKMTVIKLPGNAGLPLTISSRGSDYLNPVFFFTASERSGR